MAGDIEVTVQFPELAELKKAFLGFRPSLAKKHMGAAIRRSLKPGSDALKANVKRGPTGNLYRAISTKVKTYRSGNAVGLVGFIAAGSGKAKSAGGGTVQKGKNRAFHAGFVEFGTKERFIRSSSRRAGASIASSFKRLGPFKIAKIAKRGKFAGAVRVQTTPKYPKAFFKKAARGEMLSLKEMPIGGSLGQPPVKTAYRESLPSMRAALAVNMTTSLINAQKDLADQVPPKR